MCDFLEKIVEDDSYAAYIMSSGSIKRCHQFKVCNVAVIPDVIDTATGGGWTFQKNSPFFPIFKMYINILKERGIFQIIEDRGNNKTEGPEQTCANFDGKPIGVEKVFSLFGILLIGAGFTILLFT